MQIQRQDSSRTHCLLTIKAKSNELDQIKHKVLKELGASLKVAGFRTGKAPLHLVEKNLDQNNYQSRFLDEALNLLYTQAVSQESIKVIGNPNISLTKFVPFTTLEFQADVDILGKIKLSDYKSIKKTKVVAKVNNTDINEVLVSLSDKNATRQSVDRPSKLGDEVVIDFSGVDFKKQAIKGADGKDYPLILGSDNFIPGFEKNLVGLKKEAKKEFNLTFPKDYGVKALAGEKVTFKVEVKQVNLLDKPKLDDKFAEKVGQFKNLDDLKADIKKQLLLEKQKQENAKFESELINQIVTKSELDLPKSLVDEQIERLKTEVRQSLIYRGQTWQEMLDSLKLKEDEYVKTQLLPEAKTRVKTGLILAEISNVEKIQVTTEELDAQMQLLKDQYQDQQMQAELNKPEARQEIASRLITQKTIAKLVSLVTKK